MILTVKATDRLSGTIFLPASKSYSIRAFIVAACGGRSIIISPSDCDDALVAKGVARSLGAKVTRLSKNRFRIEASRLKPNLKRVNVKESGTTLRFILPLISLYGTKSTVTGEGTLRGRPNKFLTQTLRRMGVKVKGSGSKESIPIHFSGGALKAGKVIIDGSLSSQFISALLIACPTLDRNTELKLKGQKLVSSDYITMTRQVLKKAGIGITSSGSRLYRIRGRQAFKGLKNFTVPSDWGLAAFLLAAAALTKSNVTLKGYLKNDFVQADGHILSFLKKMGVRFSQTSKTIKIKGPFQLKGGTFSLRDCPDLVPIMSILALFAKTKTRLTDIAHARAKESDRISDLRKELLKIGADVTETKNTLIINPKKEYKANRLLDPHNDHRLAMSFAVLGLKTGVRVKNIQCSHKSYPGFKRDFKAIGAKAV